MPVFNGMRYVGDAIESVLNQSMPVAEIIVVDDGSTDQTSDMVSRFGDRVKYVYQDNAGVSAARNRGIRETDCDLVCFLDADDKFHPDKNEIQAMNFSSRVELEFCDAHSQYFWSEDLRSAQVEADPRYEHAFWRNKLHGHISTWLVRRTVFERVGLFDESLRFSEDTDWLLRYKDSGGTQKTIPHCLSYRRLHQRNLTAGSRREQVRCLARVFRNARKRRCGTH